MQRRITRSPAQIITASEAAGFVQSGMWLDYGGSLSQPDVFDKALAERRDSIHLLMECLTHCLGRGGVKLKELQLRTHRAIRGLERSDRP